MLTIEYDNGKLKSDATGCFLHHYMTSMSHLHIDVLKMLLLKHNIKIFRFRVTSETTQGLVSVNEQEHLLYLLED